MTGFAPILQYEGPALDIAGNFAKGQQVKANNMAMDQQEKTVAREEESRAQMQGILSKFGDDPEKAAQELMMAGDVEGANSVLSNAINRQSMQLNQQKMAQERIESAKQRIEIETRSAMGAVKALQGVEDPEQKSRIYDLYMKSVADQGIELPEDLKGGWSEENEQALGMISQIGQKMIDMDPRNQTAEMKNFEMTQKNPEFAAYLEKKGQREASGTEAIVAELRKEDPSLSYAQALAMAQGLARKGLGITDGQVAPMAGVLESTEKLSSADETGKQETILSFADKIEEAKITGKARGDAGVELATAKATLPKIVEIVDELGALAENATYTQIGQAWATAQRESGNEVSEADIARRKYIAVVDNEVLPLLRQTFGAAFTEREGQSLKATLGDPNASPAEKQAVLDAFLKKAEREIDTKGRLFKELSGEASSPDAGSGSMSVEQKRARLEELRRKAGK